MKKLLSILTFSLAVIAASAQEQAVYSQYQVFPILVNPGYTGFEEKHQVLVNAHASWLGFPGSANTYTLLYNGPVGDKLALGGGLFSEQIGDVSSTKLMLNYAFRFKLQKLNIGLGLSTEFLNRSIDASLLSNLNVDRNDLVLEGLVDGQQIFDATLGGHLQYDNRFFLSASLPNAIRTRLDEVPVDGGGGSSGGQHYLFQLGYIVNVPAQNFKVVPSLTFRKFRNTPSQVDINVQGRFMEDKLIAGLTFRPGVNGAAVCLLGTKINQYNIFYSYELSFSDFQRYNGGSHEISIAYSLDRKVKAAPAEGDK
jgi:type IX secretion system PorP/SprF family membrane protein